MVESYVSELSGLFTPFLYLGLELEVLLHKALFRLVLSKPHQFARTIYPENYVHKPSGGPSALTRIYFFRIAALEDLRGSRDIRNRDYDEIQRAHGRSSDAR